MLMSKGDYGLPAHRHRFAAWAAARAAQRGFAKSSVLMSALDEAGLEKFIARPAGWPKTRKAFDAWHKRRCRRLLHALGKTHKSASYGRVAKLLAVHLKAQVVCGGHDKRALAEVAHPPIDRLLLKALAAERGKTDKKLAAELRSKAWTSLTKDEYFDLLKVLRKATKDKRFWMLESYWDPRWV